jgi:hypothetical protein
MNCYTQFSVLVAEQLSAEERAWIKVQEAERESFWATGFDEDPELQQFWADLEGVEFEATENDEFVISSEEGGSPDAAAALVTEFLADHRPQELVVIEWANTASKLRPGNHGGGIAVISAKETAWFDSAKWAEETAARLRTTL